MAGWQVHICDVCRLLDSDFRQKPCFYCSTCGAWICELDLDDWPRRIAAAKRAIQEKFASA